MLDPSSSGGDVEVKQGLGDKGFLWWQVFADGKILADGKSADTFRARCKPQSRQPPVLNMYAEHHIVGLLMARGAQETAR